MTKSFKMNKKGKIEFTPEELHKLLDEVWRNGYNSNNYYYWTPPYTWTTTTPYVTWNDYGINTCTCSKTTISTGDAATSSITYSNADDKVTYTIGE